MIKTLEELNIRRNEMGGGGVIVFSENQVSRVQETQMH